MCCPTAEDVHLAPGFPSSYDSPPFYPGDQASSGRLYSSDRYSDQVFKASPRGRRAIVRDRDGLTDLPQELYPGEPGYRGTYSTFPSTDLPSPDSGIGEQVPLRST